MQSSFSWNSNTAEEKQFVGDRTKLKRRVKGNKRRKICRVTVVGFDTVTNDKDPQMQVRFFNLSQGGGKKGRRGVGKSYSDPIPRAEENR